ncbi:Ig-like domain-containing protein [Blautia sp.]
MEKITFTSSNKKVATVTSKGKVTAKKKGTAVITVKSGKIKVKCKITVR